MYVHQVFGRCQWFGPKIQLASRIKGLTITPRLTVLRKREIIFSMALNTNQSISENWLHLVCVLHKLLVLVIQYIHSGYFDYSDKSRSLT